LSRSSACCSSGRSGEEAELPFTAVDFAARLREELEKHREAEPTRAGCWLRMGVKLRTLTRQELEDEDAAERAATDGSRTEECACIGSLERSVRLRVARKNMMNREDSKAWVVCGLLTDVKATKKNSQ
jgi:hypothetical protein